MKRKLLMILSGLFFLCGLSVFLYPTIQTAAVRLVIDRAWGPLPFAHVFCLEFR